MLSRSRVSPADFESQEQRRLVLQKLIQAITAFAKVSEGELQEFFRLAREEVKVQYLVVSPETFMARVKPSDPEVAAYYQEHRAEFRLPERVRVRYLLFKPQKYLDQVQLTPGEIDAYIRDHAEEMVRPKVIRVRELFLALPPKARPEARRDLEKKAGELLRQAQAGADFIKLVQAYSQHEASRQADGDLGYLTRGQNLFSGTVSQALRPFPQYYGVTSHRTNGGFSTYNGLQLTFTKRSTYGLIFLAAYTFSKTLSTADTAGPGNYYDYGQDWYNRKSDYSVTQYNYPQHLKLTWIYDLPFGAQRHWLKSGVLSYIAGGWTMSGIQNYQSGAPLKMYTWTYGYGPPLYNPGFRPDVLLARDQQTLTKPTNVIVDEGVGPYLNPAAFADLPSTPGGLPRHLGNAPRWQPDLRGFRQVSHDFSLIKKTPIKITAGAYFEIRMDAINVFNHVRISDPNTSVSDPSSFGYIFGKAGGPLHIQVGLRLAF